MFKIDYNNTQIIDVLKTYGGGGGGGAQGPQGPQGPQGTQGAIGPTGPGGSGSNYSLSFNLSTDATGTQYGNFRYNSNRVELNSSDGVIRTSPNLFIDSSTPNLSYQKVLVASGSVQSASYAGQTMMGEGIWNLTLPPGPFYNFNSSSPVNLSGFGNSLFNGNFVITIAMGNIITAVIPGTTNSSNPQISMVSLAQQFSYNSMIKHNAASSSWETMNGGIYTDNNFFTVKTVNGTQPIYQRSNTADETRIGTDGTYSGKLRLSGGTVNTGYMGISPAPGGEYNIENYQTSGSTGTMSIRQYKNGDIKSSVILNGEDSSVLLSAEKIRLQSTNPTSGVANTITLGQSNTVLGIGNPVTIQSSSPGNSIVNYLKIFVGTTPYWIPLLSTDPSV